MGLGRLKQLWNIEGEHPRVPNAAEITAALAGTGLGDLRLAGQVVTKDDPRLAVDLGGIAKGYAVDRAIAVLQAAGVRHASVNAGGDIRLLGDRGDRPWRIGIQHPRKSDAILATLDLADTAVVTSGDYERFFERDGVRYHHLFDPATGQPARRCQSVTVVAPEAMLADALATAVFVLGPGPGLKLLASVSRLQRFDRRRRRQRRHLAAAGGPGDMALNGVWRRTRPLDRILVVLLLLLCGLLLVWLRPGPAGRRVIVERDGAVIFTAPLDQDRTVALAGRLGPTRLAIRHGSVCIEASPCPRKLCIGMGHIARSGQILACVPNGLLVRIDGGPTAAGKGGGYDLLSR